jgi:ABC-type spermidine/putrescine transport system permease subunit I
MRDSGKNSMAARIFSSGSALLLGPVLIFIGLGYLLPGVILFLMSFGHPASFGLDIDLLSVNKYQQFLTSSYYLRILGYTLLLGLIVSLITAVAAYPVAYYLARSKSRLTSFYAILTFTPLAVGMNMLTLGWMVLLGRNGFFNSILLNVGIIDAPLSLLYNWGSVIVGLVHVTFTFMVLPIEAVLRQIDPSMERAARILGAGPMRTFALVLLPLSMEGVSAGFLIVFLQTCGAFVLPLLLGGQGFTFIPVAIWEQLTVSSDRAFAAMLSVVLVLISLVIMIVQLRLLKQRTLV